MGRYFLREVTYEALRSFANKTTINLPRTGLVLLDGKNFDATPGADENIASSSGAGKSTFGLGIALGFDYLPSDYSLKSLQSWPSLTKNKLRCSYRLETDHGDAEWSVGKDPEFSYGTTSVTGSKAVAAEVRKLTGLSPEILSALTYRQQKSRGVFLSMGDTEKKEFLTTLLGLEEIEQAIEDAKDRLKALEQGIETNRAVIKLQTENYENTKSRATPLRLEDDSLLRRERETALATLADLKATLSEQTTYQAQLRFKAEEAANEAAKSFDQQIGEQESVLIKLRSESRNIPNIDRGEYDRLAQLIATCDQHIKAVEESDRAAKATYLATQTKLTQNARLLRQELNDIPKVKAEINRLHEESDKLRQSLCPTCKRTWIEAQQKLAENSIVIRSLTESLAELELKQPKLEEVEKQLSELKFEPNPMLATLANARAQVQSQLAAEDARLRGESERAQADMRARLSEVEARLAELRRAAERAYHSALAATPAMKSLEQDIANTQAQIVKTQNTLRDIEGHIGTIAVVNSAEQKRFDAQQQTISEFEKDLRILNEEFTKLEAEANAERDFVECNGKDGFLGSIFDEALEQISLYTNEILANIPNVTRVTFAFRSDYETQKGTIKKKIVPVVRVRGEEGPYKAYLSGGMQTALELAVDLAVGRVVSNRTGSFPGWLILDEAFEGFSPVEKEACLHVLSQYADERLIIVVDHETTFKEMFQKTICVKYRDAISTVE